MNVHRIIPRDFKLFNEYINRTDDEQSSVDVKGFTIYPVDAKGKRDFTNKEGRQEIVNEPMHRRWDWTAEESSKWSACRKAYGELFARLEASGNAPDAGLKGKLDKCITDFVAFNTEHDLLNRVGDGDHTTEVQRKLFNVKQDTLVLETSLGKINLLYDEDRPLSVAEKKYLEKYKALHEYVFTQWKQSKWMRSEIKEVRGLFPALWKRFYELRDESDKALQRLYFPPPSMKGGMSEMISMYIPSAEESRKLVDDFNEHLNDYVDELRAIGVRMEAVYEVLESDEEEKSESMFGGVRRLESKLFEESKISLEACSVSDEFEDFLGRIKEFTDERDLADKDWEECVNEQKLLTGTINQLIKSVGPEDTDEDEETETIDISKVQDAPSEKDDLRAETLGRYDADLKLKTNTYFDVADWHIILDHYQQKYDLKGKAEALKRARTQHPEDPALMIRAAQEEVGEHRYREALDLLKQAEDMGPPHPNLLWTKADIFVRLQTPELAIPIYQRLTRQTDKNLEWWRRNSYDRLVDIYEEKKKYDECVLLCREILKTEPGTDLTVSRLGFFLRMDNKLEEAEQVLNDFLAKHPKSHRCLDQLGHIYDKLEQHEKAAESFEKSYKLDPEENYGSVYCKGLSLMKLNRFSEAALCFELCLLQYKLDKNYHLKAAQCYAKINLGHVAAIHYRRALAMDPDSKEAMDALQEMKKEVANKPLS